MQLNHQTPGCPIQVGPADLRPGLLSDRFQGNPEYVTHSPDSAKKIKSH